MFRFVLFLTMSVLVMSGTNCARKKACIKEEVHVAPYRQFVSSNIDWSTMRRVVLMPLANQTAYPNVSNELQSNLAAELQRAGQFEIVVATLEDSGARARDVFRTGQFDELELLRVAREYQAQGVLLANVTQYHPYSPPRIGISMLLVCPGEGVVVASAEGLWDARETSTSTQALAYYKQELGWPQRVMGTERAIESPDVYQRFVCHQIAASLGSSGMKTVEQAGGSGNAAGTSMGNGQNGNSSSFGSNPSSPTPISETPLPNGTWMGPQQMTQPFPSSNSPTFPAYDPNHNPTQIPPAIQTPTLLPPGPFRSP